MNFADLAPYFSNEDKAIELIESLLWPEGPICPHCGSTEKQYAIQPKGETRTGARPGLRKCGDCRKQYTVKVGTIFEDSKIPMHKWLMVIYLMCSSKKGISASQIQRTIGVSYKAAWFMCHRVREAMKEEPLRGMLGSGGGIVEVDETYIGGKASNNKRKKRVGGGAVGKVPVMTLIERGGEVRSFIIPNTSRQVLHTIARPVVDGTAHIMTDKYSAYRGLSKHFASHETVDHSKQYVRGIIHTNFAESYHSLLKRSIIGTHHHISTTHMSRYLREREFHWNRRKATDGERTADAIRGAKGKRLLYRTPTLTE